LEFIGYLITVIRSVGSPWVIASCVHHWRSQRGLVRNFHRGSTASRRQHRGTQQVSMAGLLLLRV